MNDFVSMSNDEINRYVKMEKLLENKISRRFQNPPTGSQRLCVSDGTPYGRDGIAYEDYVYPLPKRKLKRETLIKYYDLIRPTRCVVEESQRYLRLEHEDKRKLCVLLYGQCHCRGAWTSHHRKSFISSNSSSHSLWILP